MENKSVWCALQHLPCSPHSSSELPAEQIPRCWVLAEPRAAHRAPSAVSLALKEEILFQTVPVPLSDTLCSLSLSGLGLVFPLNTYFSHVLCNWEEQLSHLCTRSIRQRGHFWISSRQRGHSWSLSNFGLLQSCFVWWFSLLFFFLEVFYTSYSSEVWSQRSCSRVEQWAGCTLWYRKAVSEGHRKIRYTSAFVPGASRMRWRIPKHLYPACRLCLFGLIASNWLSGAGPFPRAVTEVDNAFREKAK